MSWVAALVALVALLGVVCALLAALRVRNRRAGLPMLLELCTAAALLLLSARREWPSIALLAALVTLRGFWRFSKNERSFRSRSIRA
jgi:cytochrome bd-type quinol oxidase subunit 2